MDGILMPASAVTYRVYSGGSRRSGSTDFYGPMSRTEQIYNPVV